MRQNVSRIMRMDSVEPLMEGVPLHDAVLCISSKLFVVGVEDC